MRVLIPGISGVLGHMVAHRLLAEGHEVIGIDKRPWPDAPAGVEMHHVDIRKRAAEDVFRKRRPHAVIHMATVTHLVARTEERYRINLGGTRAVFEHACNYGVEHALFVGRHTYYGAGPESALYHHEDDPPMAVTTFPELADLVAADLYACTSLWRFPNLVTSVLRFCYTLGPTVPPPPDPSEEPSQPATPDRTTAPKPDTTRANNFDKRMVSLLEQALLAPLRRRPYHIPRGGWQADRRARISAPRTGRRRGCRRAERARGG